MRYPVHMTPVGRHNLWRGEANARQEARKVLDGQQIPITDDQIALLIQCVYPPIASGVLSKAMQQMLDLGDRRHLRDSLEALDLIRRRWTGFGARSRP